MRFIVPMLAALALVHAAARPLLAEEPSSPERLIAVSVGPRGAAEYSFVDSKGKTVIATGLTFARAFDKDGTALASDVAKFGELGPFGRINAKGEWVIRPKYFKLSVLSEGLRAFTLANPNESRGIHNDCGYMDASGKVVLEARFGQCQDFSQGYAFVTAERMKPGAKQAPLFQVINRAGKVVIPPSYVRADNFQDGAAWVGLRDPGARVFMSRSGALRLSEVEAVDNGAKSAPFFFAPFTFGPKELPARDEGAPCQRLWSVVKFDCFAPGQSEAGKCVGLSDPKGNIVYSNAGKVGIDAAQGKLTVEQLPPVMKGDFPACSSFVPCGTPIAAQLGACTQDGKRVIDPGFAGNVELRNVRSPCGGGGGKPVGYCDLMGKVVIPPQFPPLIHSPFREGYAAAWFNGKYTFIDRGGKKLFEEKYDRAQDFHDGLAAVAIGKKWGLIDATGKVVVPIQYDTVAY